MEVELSYAYSYFKANISCRNFVKAPPPQKKRYFSVIGCKLLLRRALKKEKRKRGIQLDILIIVQYQLY